MNARERIEALDKWWRRYRERCVLRILGLNLHRWSNDECTRCGLERLALPDVYGGRMWEFRRPIEPMGRR